MSEDKNVNNKPEDIIENKKQENPLLSVRVDQFYKDEFDELLKSSGGMKKKDLMEHIILWYIGQKRRDKKEDLISFNNEIALVSNHVTDLLKIFEGIASKSQNTIGATEERYKQEIKNLKSELETAKLKNNEIADRNRILETLQVSFEKEKKDLIGRINFLSDSLGEANNEVKDLKIENGELNKQILKVKDTEKELIKTKNELNRSIEDVESFKSDLLKKGRDLHQSSIRINQLNDSMNKLSAKYEQQLEEEKVKALKNSEKLARKLNDEYNRAIQLLKKEYEFDKLETISNAKFEMREELIKEREEKVKIKIDKNSLEEENHELKNRIAELERKLIEKIKR